MKKKVKIERKAVGIQCVSRPSLLLYICFLQVNRSKFDETFYSN